MKIGTDKNMDHILDIVVECYKAAVSRSNITEDDVSAVGMAVPSAVNTEKQILLNAPNLGWKNIKIGEIMADKLKILREISSDIDIEVDGGVNLETIDMVKNAGANVIVAGTAIFGAEDRKSVIDRFKS